MKKRDTKKAILRIWIARLMICLLIGIVVVAITLVSRESKTLPTDTVSPTPTATATPAANVSWLDRVEYVTDEIVKTGNTVEAYVVIQSGEGEEIEGFSAEYQSMVKQLNPGVQNITVYLFKSQREKDESWDWKYTDQLEYDSKHTVGTF